MGSSLNKAGLVASPGLVPRASSAAPSQASAVPGSPESFPTTFDPASPEQRACAIRLQDNALKLAKATWGDARFDATHRPSVIGSNLDPQLLNQDPSIKAAAQADFQHRLDLNRNLPSFAPVGDPDVRKPLLVWIPGDGRNEQDAHAMPAFQGHFDGYFTIYDTREFATDSAKQMARAIVQLQAYRAVLAQKQGITLVPVLRLLGHSQGGLEANLVVHELAKMGVLTSGPNQLFMGVSYVQSEAPQRGFAVPWPLTTEPVEKALGWVVRHTPISPDMKWNLTDGTLALASTKVWRTVLSPFPATVDLQVDTNEDGRGGPYLGGLLPNPVDDMYPDELQPGELERIWEVLKTSATPDLEQLAHTRAHGLIQDDSLRRLFTPLWQSQKGPQLFAALHEAAVQADNLGDFQTRYSQTLEKFVQTSHVPKGHTAHLNDPTFIDGTTQIFSVPEGPAYFPTEQSPDGSGAAAGTSKTPPP
jgi:hypothetical protein